MSKILDTLRQQENKKSEDYIQEQLAEIYISPTEKKELPDQKKKRDKNNLTVGWVGLVLAISAVLLAALVFLLSIYKMDVNITVIREALPLKPDSAGPDLTAGAFEETSGFVLGGFPDNTISFNGSASAESKLTDQHLYLVNGRGLGWSNVQLTFTQPLNARDSALSLSAKGEKGGEYLLIILKDADGKTYQAINVAPDGLSKDWRSYSIRLSKADRWINTGSISQIKLEFGSITANNPIGAAIYIKELSLNKERRI